MAGLMGQFSTVIQKTKALAGRPIGYLLKPKQHKQTPGVIEASQRERKQAEGLVIMVSFHLLLIMWWTYDARDSHWQDEIDGWRPQVDNLLSANIKRSLQASFPKLYSKAVNEFQTRLRNNIRNDSKRKAALQKLLRHGPDASRPDFDLSQVLDASFRPTKKSG